VTQAKSIRFIGCVLLSYEIAMVFWMNIYVLLGENGETSAKGHISSIVFSVYSSAVPSHKYVSKREKNILHLAEKSIYFLSALLSASSAEQDQENERSLVSTPYGV
jgi:hypothetical protein